MKHLFTLALTMTMPAACSRPEPGEGKPTGVSPAGQTKSATGTPLKLIVAHIPNLCNVTPRVALARGFFEAEGLDVQLLPADFSGEHQHVASTVLGSAGRMPADITVIEYPALELMALGKLNYYVVGGEHSGCRQLIVLADSHVQGLADLKGKRVGLPPFNDSLMWEYLARQAGVGPGSIKWVPTKSAAPDDIKRDLAAGRVDAHVTSDPAGEVLISQGLARRLASNTWTSPLSGWYCCMIAVRREIVDAHPEAAGAVMRAYRKGAAFVEKNPAEAVALSVDKGYMARETPQELSARLLGEYVWTATGRIVEDLERYFKLLIEAGRLPATSSTSELLKLVYRSGE